MTDRLFWDQPPGRSPRTESLPRERGAAHIWGMEQLKPAHKSNRASAATDWPEQPETKQSIAQPIPRWLTVSFVLLMVGGLTLISIVLLAVTNLYWALATPAVIFFGARYFYRLFPIDLSTEEGQKADARRILICVWLFVGPFVVLGLMFV